MSWETGKHAVRGGVGAATRPARNRPGRVRVARVSSTPPSWGFLARLQPGLLERPGELSIGLHRAVGELRRAARVDPLRAGAGAVQLLERLPAALEHIDYPVRTAAGAGHDSPPSSGLIAASGEATPFSAASASSSSRKDAKALDQLVSLQNRKMLC